MRNLKTILEQVDQGLLADDDHPNKPDITKQECIGALKELMVGRKKGGKKKDILGQATVDALNKIK